MAPGTSTPTAARNVAAEYDFWPADRVRAAARAGVRLVVTGELATVTLDRPEKRNAMTPSMWWQLAQIGRALPPSVRAVLLCAEGPSFSAGLDRSMFVGEDSPNGAPAAKTLLDLGRSDAHDADLTIAAFQEAFTWWRRPDLLTVAAVQGHAVGAGFQLALACDLRIVSEDARFAMREISLGLVPDLGGTKPLTALVGYARALEICATGRWVEAAEAERIGLANKVVPTSELRMDAEVFLRELLAADRDALIETKSLLQGAIDRDYEAQCAAERAAQVRRIRALAALSPERPSSDVPSAAQPAPEPPSTDFLSASQPTPERPSSDYLSASQPAPERLNDFPGTSQPTAERQNDFPNTTWQSSERLNDFPSTSQPSAERPTPPPPPPSTEPWSPAPWSPDPASD